MTQSDLFVTILELCNKEKYLEIPKNLVSDILKWETDLCDRPSEALTKIKQIIEDYVEEVISNAEIS